MNPDVTENDVRVDPDILSERSGPELSFARNECLVHDIQVFLWALFVPKFTNKSQKLTSKSKNKYQ